MNAAPRTISDPFQPIENASATLPAGALAPATRAGGWDGTRPLTAHRVHRAGDHPASRLL